jgi:hypothetical protein
VRVDGYVRARMSLTGHRRANDRHRLSDAAHRQWRAMCAARSSASRRWLVRLQRGISAAVLIAFFVPLPKLACAP